MHNSVISQYIVQNQEDKPTTVGQLCDSIAAENDVDANLLDFYLTAWDIQTAQGVWLDYWGIWVGIGRYLQVVSSYANWGVAPDSGTFNNSVFYNGALSTNNYRLPDYVYRKLILIKAFANISGCSIPVLNQCLLMFFDGRRAYAVDNFDMTVTINIEFTLADWEYSVLTLSNAFPKCAGVRYNYTFYTSGFFGFAPDSGTFDNSTFRN